MPAFELTEHEKTLLEAIDQSSTVTQASNTLRYNKGMEKATPNNCYQTLYRIRERYKAAQKYVNTILALRRRSPLLKKVLTPKVPMEES